MCAVRCISLSEAVTDLCSDVRANDPWPLMWKTHLCTPPVGLSVLSWSRTPTCSSRPWRRPERECKSTYSVTHCSILRVNSAPKWSTKERQEARRQGRWGCGAAWVCFLCESGLCLVFESIWKSNLALQTHVRHQKKTQNIQKKTEINTIVHGWGFK